MVGSAAPDRSQLTAFVVTGLGLVSQSHHRLYQRASVPACWLVPVVVLGTVVVDGLAYPELAVPYFGLVAAHRHLEQCGWLVASELFAELLVVVLYVAVV